MNLLHCTFHQNQALQLGGQAFNFSGMLVLSSLARLVPSFFCLVLIKRQENGDVSEGQQAMKCILNNAATSTMQNEIYQLSYYAK